MSDEIAYLEEVNVMRYVQNLTSSRKLAERAGIFLFRISQVQVILKFARWWFMLHQCKPRA